MLFTLYRRDFKTSSKKNDFFSEVVVRIYCASKLFWRIQYGCLTDLNSYNVIFTKN